MSPPARAQRTPRSRRRPATADIGTCRRRQRPGPGMPCATAAATAPAARAPRRQRIFAARLLRPQARPARARPRAPDGRGQGEEAGVGVDGSGVGLCGAARGPRSPVPRRLQQCRTDQDDFFDTVDVSKTYCTMCCTGTVRMWLRDVQQFVFSDVRTCARVRTRAHGRHAMLCQCQCPAPGRMRAHARSAGQLHTAQLLPSTSASLEPRCSTKRSPCLSYSARLRASLSTAYARVSW